MRFTPYVLPVLFYAVILLVTACSGVDSQAKYPTGADRASTEDIYADEPSIFGAGGVLGAVGMNRNKSDGSQIGVNAYLWRASLDTVSFMPLESADPFGGVILTDWYTPSATPDERLKINVFIINKELRSDGLRVRVFKQVAQGNQWVDQEVSAETVRQIEDAILTRARQLRVADL
jgi:hypothetical protein